MLRKMPHEYPTPVGTKGPFSSRYSENLVCRNEGYRRRVDVDLVVAPILRDSRAEDQATEPGAVDGLMPFRLTAMFGKCAPE